MGISSANLGKIYEYAVKKKNSFEKSSKQVYKQMKPKDLRKLYYPYHSLDPARAIERILEGNGSREEDYTEKGVEFCVGFSSGRKKKRSINRTAVLTEKSERSYNILVI